MQAPPTHIQSAANPLFKQLRQLARDNHAWRKQQRLWLEGDHLCRAALARGWQPELTIWSASGWARAHGAHATASHAPEDNALAPLTAASAARTVVLDDALMARISALPSPAPVACVFSLPAPPTLQPDAPTVVLDRVQDAGNVGAILRSAAAFGFVQIVALQGSAALWSPKVLRAGMGAHFALHLLDSQPPEALHALRVPLLVTHAHQGQWLHSAPLPWPCAWVLGHEGQGVDPALVQRADMRVRIVQPGGQESLNVAAAAAICLHASSAGQAPA